VPDRHRRPALSYRMRSCAKRGDFRAFVGGVNLAVRRRCSTGGTANVRVT